MSTCKAAVAWKPRRSLTVEEMEVPPPKTHEVLVQGRLTSLVTHSFQNSIQTLSPHLPMRP
uniref:Uncharacterized protein n=1 Tax=Oryzias latipes TaxID=8090 RepID=A0A3P9I9R2_ORYLA